MLEIKTVEKVKLYEDIFLYQIGELGKYWAFNTKTGEHFTLNKTSYYILERCDGEKTIDELMLDFLGYFDVSTEEGTADCNQIIQNLHDFKIIKWEGKNEPKEK